MSMALQCSSQARQARMAAVRWPLQQFVNWVWFDALPLWSRDGEGGFLPFAERCDLAGRPCDPGYVRLRVMTRQVAVYAQAGLAGWQGGDRLARRGWRALTSLYWHHGQGWGSRVNVHGCVIDDRFELYDQAFALYACAHWARASGDKAPLALARQTLELIDRRLRDQHQPGWRTSDRRDGRDQNSHMHFLEALMALHETGGVEGVEKRIEAILRVAESKLYDARSGTILEHFDDHWMVPAAVATVEPGHLLEWCWLVAKAKGLGFETVLPTERFLAFVRCHGVSRLTGLLYDRCAPHGAPLGLNHRLWPHCEELRALAVGESRPNRAVEAEAAAQRLMKSFLTAPAAGCWIERLSPELRPIGDHVPATSLYHLWEAARAVVEAGWAQWPGRGPC